MNQRQILKTIILIALLTSCTYGHRYRTKSKSGSVKGQIKDQKVLVRILEKDRNDRVHLRHPVDELYKTLLSLNRNFILPKANFTLRRNNFKTYDDLEEYYKDDSGFVLDLIYKREIEEAVSIFTILSLGLIPSQEKIAIEIEYRLYDRKDKSYTEGKIEKSVQYQAAALPYGKNSLSAEKVESVLFKSLIMDLTNYE